MISKAQGTLLARVFITSISLSFLIGCSAAWMLDAFMAVKRENDA